MRTLSRLFAATLCLVVAVDALALTTWVRTYHESKKPPASSEIRLNSIEPTSDGGYIGAGVVAVAHLDREYDSLVMKLDAGGNITWQKTFGVDYGRYEPKGVYQTADGGYVVSESGRPSRVVWLSAAGDVLRQKSYAGRTRTRLLPTADGGFAIGGEAYDASIRADVPSLAKFDINGNVMWMKHYLGAAVSSGFEVTLERGLTIIGGYFTGPGYTASTSVLTLLELDQEGNVERYRELTPDTSVNGRTFRVRLLLPTLDGGYVIAGNIGDYERTSFAILKIDAHGAPLWQKEFRSSQRTSLSSIHLNADGSYLVVGSAAFAPMSTDSALFLKLDNGGNIAWQRVLSSESSLVPQRVGSTADGGYVVSGPVWAHVWVAKLDAFGKIQGCGNVSDSEVAAVSIEPPMTVTVIEKPVTAVQATATVTNDELPVTNVPISGRPLCYSPAPPTGARAVEYFHAGYGHYFVSAFPEEVAALDSGAIPGWTRTRQVFDVFPLGTPSTSDTCRFWSGDTFAPKSSHFYAASETECTSVRQNPDWQFEGEVFAVGTTILGVACGEGLTPLYRLYNDGKGGAPNHRYTTSTWIAAVMPGQGWIPEGSGLGIVGCVPQH